MSTVKKNIDEYKRIRNLEQSNKKYYEKNDGTAAAPHTICLSVNNNCFMKCKMCDIGQSNADKNTDIEDNFFSSRYKRNGKYQEFPLDRAKSLVDELHELRPIIKTNFVEPLIYKKIQELAEYVKSKGLPYYTITNGWLLEKNANWLVEAGTDLIRVSLDGPEDIHDRIRGVKGSFKRTVAGLWELIEKKQKLGVDKPILGVCYTISDENYASIVDFMEYLKNTGLFNHIYLNINHLQFTTQWEVDATRSENQIFNNFKKCSIDRINLKKIDIKALEQEIATLNAHFDPEQYHYYFTPYLKRNDLNVYYDHDARMFPGTPCYLPWYTAQIDLTGEVGIYGHCLLPSFGNIMNKSFLDVWNSEKARTLRLTLKKNKSFTGCNRCIGTLYPLRGRE